MDQHMNTCAFYVDTRTKGMSRRPSTPQFGTEHRLTRKHVGSEPSPHLVAPVPRGHHSAVGGGGNELQDGLPLRRHSADGPPHVHSGSDKDPKLP